MMQNFDIINKECYLKEENILNNKTVVYCIFRGLLDRVNEMRYAYPAKPLEREAAHHAVQQRALNNGAPVCNGIEGNILENGLVGNLNAPPSRAFNII